MRSQALQIVRESQTPDLAALKLREYLQHVILRGLAEQKELHNWILHGGTGLRIIHGLNRFSEDLDFYLKEPSKAFDLTPIIHRLRHYLGLQGYTTSATPIKIKTVRSTFIKFEGLLFESGLSANESEKLSIKLEVDSNPPSGWEYERKLVNTYFPFSVLYHDPPSFLAGKLHALLQRPYTKGRDLYDIIYLLSRWEGLNPNFNYLDSALDQTGYEGVVLSPDTWRTVIADFVSALDWSLIRDDVRPFLFSQVDQDLMDLEILLQLLKDTG